MKRSFGFTEKSLVTISAVLIGALCALVGALKDRICTAREESEFFLILASGFCFILLIGVVIRLASSLRQPVAPAVPRELSAMRLALQRNLRLMGLIGVVTLETAIAAILIWSWALLPLQLGSYVTAMGDTLEHEHFYSMVQQIRHAYPFRFVQPEWLADDRYLTDETASSWSKAEAISRSSAIVLVWLFRVGIEVSRFIKRPKVPLNSG
jgi:hypothetical protein